MPRLFVAVRITPTAPLQAALDTLGALRGVKGVEPANLHYTIRFIGDVSDGLASAIEDVFRGGALEVSPFEAAMTGVGAFPKPHDPRVVWVGTDETGDRGLKGIAGGIDDFLETAGVGPRDKPFVSHLTLARVKHAAGRARDDLQTFIGENRDTEFGLTLVTHVQLVKSTLTPQGAIYEDIEELKLE